MAVTEPAELPPLPWETPAREAREDRLYELADED